MIQIKLTSDKAKIPTKGSEYAAGYDLFSIEDSIKLEHSERKLFKTGIHIKIPEGYYGRIAPRSGLSLKQGIDVMAGIIDADYIGELGIILVNLNIDPVIVDTTKPIAQLIIERHYDMIFQPADELDQTKRGIGGYGSTDIKHQIKDEKISLTERYQKTGGVSIKERYTEEMRRKNSDV